MKIANIEIKNGLFLAPMASVTDKPFRTLCKMLGVGLKYTEMVSVKGLYYKSKKTEQLLDTSEIERPCAVQLFGHEPEIFRSVLKGGVLDKFDIIDINMGCPAPKIVKNGDGSALMKNLDLARDIIKACVESTNKPVTVKFRKGFYKSDDKLVEFAKMCQESGASAITIHPRTREDMFSGSVNLEDIKKVKQNVSIPVIGNGDVVDLETYYKMAKICDGVMIGREALKKPEIFFEINNSLSIANKIVPSFFDFYRQLVENENNNSFSNKLIKNEKIKKENISFNFPTKEQIIKMHLTLLKKEYCDEFIVKIFKKYILSYLSGLKNSTDLKREIVLINDLKVMEEMIFNYFNNID